MSTLAVGAIDVYRRHISPRKGYRCAHNALHHCGSCSDFGLRVYRRLAFMPATALMLRRLQACRAAYLAIKADVLAASLRDEDERRKKSRAEWSPLDALNCCTPVPDATCIDVGGCEVFSCVPW